MSKLNQRGVIAQVLILILLILGAVVGVYLVQNRTNLFPKAGGSRPLGPQNSFTLMGPKVCKNGWVCYLAGRPGLKEEFEVKLYAKSDLEEANLFTAKMTFPKDVVEVREIKTEGSFIKNWVEEYYDNETGEINLSGGVPNPGYKTQIGKESVLMATITFHAKALGKGEISFTDSSAIYSNLNNINILTMTEGYDISVEATPPSPTPSSTPIATCSYDSTQARLQRDIKDPWVNSKIVNGGDKIRVGGFHDGAGLLASDVKLEITGPKNCSADSKSCTQIGINPANGDYITSPSTVGTYTLTVTTLGQSGSGCRDVATFQVQDKTNPKGDGNKDGKINLIDMSVLHTDWNIDKDVVKKLRDGIDMNNDGLINTADFAALRQLLQDLKVIKAK